MSSAAPVEMFWDGEADCLRPTGGWLGRARKAFVTGEIYHIVQQEPRSTVSHNHYFACVESAWNNLPEILAERFKTPDHLRKYALIKTGWNTSQTTAAGSHAAALRIAAFIQSDDEFALAIVEGAVVTAFRAKTQSSRMGNEDFKKSKQDVLDFLSNMIGVNAAQLTKAGAAA